jgi:hypothetical protein
MAAVVETPVETVVEAPNEDAAYEETWARLHADEEPAAEAVAEAPAVAEKVETPQVEVPTDLPAGLKERWADIPEAARDVILSTQRDLSSKLATQGRLYHTIKPIHEVVARAAQEIPGLNEMTGEQVAERLFTIAKMEGDFFRNPAQTLIKIAQDNGALDALRSALSGQPAEALPAQVAQIAPLMAKIAQLAARLEGQPAAIKQAVTETALETEVLSIITKFATDNKAEWGAVEADLPGFVAIAKNKATEGASAQDILSNALEMAVFANPELRAKRLAAALPAPAATDPKRTEAAIKAKSVNVTGSPPKPRPMTEEEAMNAIWAKHHGDRA